MVAAKREKDLIIALLEEASSAGSMLQSFCW
jgi:hypothetical protein